MTNHEGCEGDYCEQCKGEFSHAGRAEMYQQLEYEDNKLIQLARDYLGTACRDNSREELIEIGRQIEEGTWE